MLKLEEKSLIQSASFLSLGGQRFHYIWLRDNCLCPECHHASSFQKIYDISDRSRPPKPKSAYIQDEKLIVEWDEDPPHRSIYPLTWLWSHAYDLEPESDRLLPKLKSPPRDEKILWNRADLEADPTQRRPNLASSNVASWIDQLYRGRDT